MVLENKGCLFSEKMHNNLEQILPDMRQSAHAYLLKPVHEGLKVSKLLAHYFATLSQMFLLWLLPAKFTQR